MPALAGKQLGEIMSNNPQSIEELTAIYMSQSPSAFISVAMHAKAPNDYNSRIDEEEHGGNSKCDYCCCSETGCCEGAKWKGILVGGAAITCICCCYCTHGFNGLWTYCPF